MNKKKTFGFLAILVIAAVAAWNVNVNTQVTLSDVALENIEALANDGGSGGADGEGGTLYGNIAGTRFCCCPGSNSCGAAACSFICP
jgi:hypothetical protein